MGEQTRRILCLWFPDWAVQRRLVAQPKLKRSVFLLTESLRRGEFVRYCNRLAQKRGIRVGMPVSEARTFIHSQDRLVVETVQPTQDQQALVKLALRCERFSFRIGLEESIPVANIVMDITGIAHFFAGEQKLAEELHKVLAKEHYDARIAIADTIGAAWAAAHFLARARKPIVIAPGEFHSLKKLPVQGLRLDDTTLAKLYRLGLRTIAQLLALDRISLAHRLGTDVLMRIDQLTGQRHEYIIACQAPPRYFVERNLEDGISHPQIIDQLLSLLTQQLFDLLAPKGLGTRHLEYRFLLEDRTAHTLTLRLCDATNDQGHIRDLLRLKQENLRLLAPVVGLQLEAKDVGFLEPIQQELFAGVNQDYAQQFTMLLNRLISRLGSEVVCVPRLLSDPVPERAFCFRAPSEESVQTSTALQQRFHALDRPTVLFPKPRPIRVILAMPGGAPSIVFWGRKRFDIAQQSEPERIESGWWQGEYICRDYYRLETVSGQWLWVFRRLQDNNWFWHGELF